jgi:hypothetical protein
MCDCREPLRPERALLYALHGLDHEAAAAVEQQAALCPACGDVFAAALLEVVAAQEDPGARRSGEAGRIRRFRAPLAALAAAAAVALSLGLVALFADGPPESNGARMKGETQRTVVLRLVPPPGHTGGAIPVGHRFSFDVEVGGAGVLSLWSITPAEAPDLLVEGKVTAAGRYVPAPPGQGATGWLEHRPGQSTGAFSADRPVRHRFVAVLASRPGSQRLSPWIAQARDGPLGPPRAAHVGDDDVVAYIVEAEFGDAPKTP